MKREDVIECYLMNSHKVVAEMLYDTIDRYEKELKKGQDNYDKLWDMYSELKKELKKSQDNYNLIWNMYSQLRRENQSTKRRTKKWKNMN